MTSTELEQEIVGLVSSGDVKVPPYPAVAFQIEKLVRSGDFGLDQLGKLVASDQVISADVLRCANSVVYSRGATVSSVPAAVQRIGARDVGRIALASGLARHASAAGALAAVRRRVWVDSLASAMLCQALAKGRNLAADVAFSAGLLHDFGKVIAVACIEDVLSRRKDAGQKPVEEWEKIVERFHVELGMVMAARWDLPPLIADVITLHHATSIKAASDPRLVETVVATDEVTAALRERTHLEAADLQATLLLDEAEHPVVLRTVEALPQFVASFEAGEPARAAAARSAIAPSPLPARGAAPAAPSCSVELSLGARRQEFKILGVANTHLMLTGPAAMPEHLLLGMEVKAERPVKGFASVKLVWQENGAYTLLVQPYALAGEALERWRSLVAVSLQVAA
jgi:putative nucleotidyltransferase with HDIG domain